MIRSLFSKKPRKYTEKVDVKFIETLYFGGYTRTADKLFTDEKTDLQPLVFHVFNYDYENVKYEFKLRDDREKIKFNADSEYEALVNPDEPVTCWFQKMEMKGYLWEPDDDDDEY